MEVVMPATILAFLGIPIGIVVTYFARDELETIKKTNLYLKQFTLFATFFSSAFLFSFSPKFKYALIFLSLTFLLFEMGTKIMFAIFPFYLFSVSEQKNFYIAASLVFIYAVFCGMALYQKKKKASYYIRPVSRYAHFLVLMLFLLIYAK